jgi:hypothetical protein
MEVVAFVNVRRSSTLCVQRHNRVSVTPTECPFASNRAGFVRRPVRSLKRPNSHAIIRFAASFSPKLLVLNNN